MGVTTLPWVIKPVYGFLTDGLPASMVRVASLSATCAAARRS